ncbi:uncharacterized protein B0H18DRAFT_972478 [Fomitopsis serialis]|uniref:uncharacterized protein n=1 Tax=Fomitopsis serialis TaxID=139415 RepID=UPI002007AB86|nr:uncharacterized protein B0H18DRAFT_972478 [Neoantrodia serialis]KAH9936145.1 hypothetical protein B0H18DRAFT_972478 [Neoantrodia serialis]
MFSLPQPTDHSNGPTNNGSSGDTSADSEYKDGLPVIVVQEQSFTLDRLLRLCYPVPKLPLHTIDILSPVLTAAIKSANLARKLPVRTYCLAVHHGFVEEAEEAARATLKLPRRMLYTSIPGIPELDLVDGKAPLLLLDYHQRCSDALSSLRVRLPFLSRDWTWFKCTAEGDVCPLGDHQYILADGTSEEPAKWWSEYMRAAVDKLEDTPSSEEVRSDTQLFETALKKAYGCESCRETALQQMRIFTVRLMDYIDTQVSKIPLSLPDNLRPATRGDRRRLKTLAEEKLRFQLNVYQIHV